MANRNYIKIRFKCFVQSNPVQSSPVQDLQGFYDSSTLQRIDTSSPLLNRPSDNTYPGGHLYI